MKKDRKFLRRLVSAATAASVLFLACQRAWAGPSLSEQQTGWEQAHAELSMEAAAQEMVLLENEGQALPVSKEGGLALFGEGAIKTVKGGTGSGDVNNRYSVSVWDAMKAAGYPIATGDWLNACEETYERAKAEYVGDWFGTVSYEEILIPDEVVKESRKETDTAVYVIARTSGEGTDRTAKKGDYYLSETEEENLRNIGAAFETVIVVLNTGGVMDTEFFHDIDGLDALLLMSQAGMEGGTALVRVLSGEVTPSGKLTDTWAKDYDDYPSSAAFGANDKDTEQEFYSEGIYVGYRYFDTFDVTPAYEFGYGLSYTTFGITDTSVAVSSGSVTVTASVENTGNTWSGREVVEIYVSKPQGSLEKPYQELAGYAKTDELAPGESQTLTVSFPVTELSSYSEEQAAYLMEAGDYIIRVGNSSRNTQAAAILRLDETAVTEQLCSQLDSGKTVKELSREGVQPWSYEGEEREIAAAEVISLSASEIPAADHASAYEDETVTAYVSKTTQREYLAENLSYELENPYHGSYNEEKVLLEGDFSNSTLEDVSEGRITLEEFVSGLTVSEMADLVIGGNKLASASGQSAGAASENLKEATPEAIALAEANSVEGAAGETAGIYIESKKIPNIILADGPAGLRLTQEYEDEDGKTYYQFCTAWPVGTLLAQTWDTELIEKIGAAIGEEMVEYGVTILLAPGMNIHRNPLCGRNFEYYSEDPFLTGTMGIAQTTGIQSHPGIGACIKHYAANNQEANRTEENNNISERTFREIYLKGFEMAVRGAQPMCIMTAYNSNNGIPTADDYDLLTDLARGEWGFLGLIMSDWGGGQSEPSLSMHAGNDLIQPGASVEDITIRAFTDEEPLFGEDGVYPEVVTESGWMGAATQTEWGEFVPDADGDVRIEKTVDTALYRSAQRERADEDGELVQTPISELIRELGDAASVTENADGTTTVVYTGYYRQNNISLGDLQKSVLHILNVILQTSQFAKLVGMEAVSYTRTHRDSLLAYLTCEKSEVLQSVSGR